MNRRGYSLRKVRKTKPLKKIPETNEFFDNIQAAHQRAANDQSIVRISIDDKAKVKLTKEEFACIRVSPSVYRGRGHLVSGAL